MGLRSKYVCVIILCVIICISGIFFEINWKSEMTIKHKPSQTPVYPGNAFEPLVHIEKKERMESCPSRKLSYMEDTDPHRIRIALASFPGSGNTWARHLIQELTGYYTGSVYDDFSLAKNGFAGELAAITDQRKQCIVYKTHLARIKFKKGLILMRNPLAAIKSFFNFLYGKNVNQMKKHSFQNEMPLPSKHTAIVPSSFFKSSTFTKFLERQLSVWKNHYIEWLKQFQGNCLVVLYEDLKSNLPFELRRIATFLDVSARPKDIICTVNNQEGNFHRTEKKSNLDLLSILQSKHKKLINGAVQNVSGVANKLNMKLNISQYLL